MTALAPIRRVVTANRPDGSSWIAEDGPAPHVRTASARPGMRVTDVWTTGTAPAPIDSPDAAGSITGLLPPPGGTLFRIIDFPPEHPDPAEHARSVRASFGQLYPDYPHEALADAKPGLHRTCTVDYAVVLAGEIIAVMDSGETTLATGDILIQRGTNHGWRNRSGAPARLLFVLIDSAAGEDAK